MSEPARRGVLRAAAALALGGCGFRPIHGDGGAAGDPVVARELAATRVAPIPDRFGQLLRRSLQQRLGGSGTPATVRWDLIVAPSFAAEGLGVQPDGTVTRVRYTATANWTFNRVNPRETVANGFERTLDAYNIQPSQFFAADASRDAMERRIADQLAEEVVTRLAMRLRGLQSGAAPQLIAPVAAPPAAPEPIVPMRPLAAPRPGSAAICRAASAAEGLTHGQGGGAACCGGPCRAGRLSRGAAAWRGWRLVRERAEALVRAVLGGAMDDPFRFGALSRDEAARPGVLAGEAAALAMTGGRRVVRVRDATDAHAEPLAEALATAGDALILLEAGELGARSRLRAIAEASPAVAVIACYRERGDELAATLARMFREAGVEADRAALEWLAARLGEDRMQTRREVEKIALYAGPGGRVDEAAAMACGADGAALDLDDAVLAAAAGNAALADRALAAAFAAGVSPVQVVRAASRHIQRLHEAAVQGGDAGALRPPVFFRHRAAFDRALARWSAPALEAAGTALLEAEKRTKTTAFGAADTTIARAAIAALARQAGR